MKRCLTEREMELNVGGGEGCCGDPEICGDIEVKVPLQQPDVQKLADDKLRELVRRAGYIAEYRHNIFYRNQFGDEMVMVECSRLQQLSDIVEPWERLLGLERVGPD